VALSAANMCFQRKIIIYIASFNLPGNARSDWTSFWWISWDGSQ